MRMLLMGLACFGFVSCSGKADVLEREYAQAKSDVARCDLGTRIAELHYSAGDQNKGSEWARKVAGDCAIARLRSGG